ncbi:MAG: hypothetical protein ACE5FP_10430 [Gemmatimonadota bacterium]
MRWMRATATIGLFVLTLPTAARAQEHAVSQQELDALVTAHAESVDADRAAIEAWLARPDVARLARNAEIDILQAEASVATLGAEDIRQLAVQLDRLDATLAGGGDAITIQTTTLIIVLLVLIIIL